MRRSKNQQVYGYSVCQVKECTLTLAHISKTTLQFHYQKKSIRFSLNESTEFKIRIRKMGIKCS